MLEFTPKSSVTFKDVTLPDSTPNGDARARIEVSLTLPVGVKDMTLGVELAEGLRRELATQTPVGVDFNFGHSSSTTNNERTTVLDLTLIAPLRHVIDSGLGELDPPRLSDALKQQVSTRVTDFIPQWLAGRNYRPAHNPAAPKCWDRVAVNAAG